MAGCSLPGRSGDLAGDLAWLREQGITAVLSLTETPLEDTENGNLSILHLPVPDLHPPRPVQLLAALDFIDLQPGPVAVHCLMGQGRTGTVLAAYLIRQGMTPHDAIARVRVVCPGAIESPLQERALTLFAARRDWIL